MDILWLLGIAIAACFLLVVLRGAPYVPTHAGWARRAVGLAPKQGTLVDLGSGDGVLLLAAAKSGRRALGIELNPWLVLLSNLRLRRYPRVQVKLGDFWLQQLPDDTSAVFVFLAGPFMNKLDQYLQREARRLGRDVQLISYGFRLPGHQIVREEGPLTLQRIKASLQAGR